MVPMLLRLPYLALSSVFTLIRLWPMTEKDKDAEILVLRHQLAVLQRQAGKLTLTWPDRAVLAALLHQLPRWKLRRLPLLVSPDTVLRWHRDLLRRHHAKESRPKRSGRPRTVRSIRLLVLRLAGENPVWGYRRIHGELAALGIKVAASTVWNILHEAGFDPAPKRHRTTWATFLHSQAQAIVALDFFETRTLTGARLTVLAAIEHATRRIRILGATAHPTAQWVTQVGRNLAMDFQDADVRVKYLIRDHDARYPDALDAVLAGDGIETVKTGVRMPRMNSLMERWIRSCRAELLDRTLIWNQAHLLHTLREYEQHFNNHRPHRALHAAAPLRALPQPITDPAQLDQLDIRRRDRLGGTLHEYRHAA